MPADTRSGFLRALTRGFGEVKSILITLALVILAETVIAQPFIVPSGSMEPTLLVGDEIAATKFAYGYDRYSLPFGLTLPFNGRIFARPPKRGDVVVFALPRDPSEDYVKRVIGLPGDRIQMRKGQLYINGQEVPRRPVGPVTLMLQGRPMTVMEYVETLPGGVSHYIAKISNELPLNNTKVYVVPKGCYFMMGDNRDDSLDSRVPASQGGVGYVPANHLIGRVDRILFSITPFTGWGDALSHLGDLSISRVFKDVHFHGAPAAGS